MHKLELFSVQRCLDPNDLSFGPPVTVEALSALDAAEKALGQSLSVIGDRERLVGRVFRMTEDYRTATTMVFSQQITEATNDDERL